MFLKLSFFYLSYLVFPLFILLFWFLLKDYKKRFRLSLVIGMLLCTAFIWSRFIEPRVVIVEDVRIEVGFSGKIALISDLHMGVYKGEDFLQKVVNNLNSKEVDLVLIAGDFTHYPDIDRLDRIFSPFNDLEHPAFGVLGNHDVEKPGPKLRDELTMALQNNGVTVLNNEIVEFNNFKLIGLGSRLNNEDNIDLLQEVTYQDNTIVLAHNPDTSLRYNDDRVDISFFGHTHGAQVKVPFIYESWLPGSGVFNEGLYETPQGKVYVTSGLGEAVLPMRLLNPPVIDIIELE
jgi:predicted MPP superfamily phosphohydrolase